MIARRRMAAVAAAACALVLSTELLPALAAAQSASPRTHSEPSAREVVRMALRAARRLEVAHVRDLMRRARLAGLLPQLRLSAERGLGQDLSSSTSAESDRTQQASNDDLSLGATLTFDLDRLVFAAEEVRLLSIDRWLASDRRKLITEVLRLYFQRRRLLRERAGAAAEDPELTDAIAEIEALLDALTDGAFARAT